MKKEEIINKIREYVPKQYDSTGGYVEHSFFIHQKKGNSFQVRKGNFIKWDEKEFLTIIFTKEFREVTPDIDTEKGFLNLLVDIGKGFLHITALSKVNEEERKKAERRKFKWFWIEDIG